MGLVYVIWPGIFIDQAASKIRKYNVPKGGLPEVWIELYSICALLWGDVSYLNESLP